MFDDLAAYFYENVVTPFEEYLDVKNTSPAGRSRDTRTALVAATSLYHLREQLPPQYSLTRAAIAGQCPDYDLLGDIVNAAKHRSLTRGTPQISDATQIQEFAVITQYKDEHGPYRWVEKVVLAKLSNGSEKDVLEVLTNVMNFWQRYFVMIGVITKPRNYGIPTHTEPRSRAECANRKLDLEIVRGLRFRQSWRLQVYNYAARKIEPMDLTGSQLQFKIYPKAPLNVELSLRHVSGADFTKTVTLTEEDSEEIERLNTEEEKQSYVEGLAVIKEALRELAKEAGLLDGQQ